jgi:hypothetical protein
LELNFPFACCCQGVNDQESLPLEEIAKAAQSLVRKILALTAKDLDLPVSAKRVYAENPVKAPTQSDRSCRSTSVDKRQMVC